MNWRGKIHNGEIGFSGPMTARDIRAKARAFVALLGANPDIDLWAEFMPHTATRNTVRHVTANGLRVIKMENRWVTVRLVDGALVDLLPERAERLRVTMRLPPLAAPKVTTGSNLVERKPSPVESTVESGPFCEWERCLAPLDGPARPGCGSQYLHDGRWREYAAYAYLLPKET